MLKKIDWDKRIFGIVPVYGVMPLIIAPIFNMLTFTGTRPLTQYLHHHDVYSKLDQAIPFCPEWMLVYVFAFPVWGIGFIMFAREERKICYELFIAELLAKLLVLICFFVFPTVMVDPQVDPEFKVKIQHGFIGWLCRFVYGFDEPNNLFPSIHCLESWILFRGAFRMKHVGKKYTAFMFVAAIFIFISVLLVKQHVIIDIIGAIAVVEIALFLSKKYNLGRVYFALERKLSGKNTEGK